MCIYKYIIYIYISCVHIYIYHIYGINIYTYIYIYIYISYIDIIYIPHIYTMYIYIIYIYILGYITIHFPYGLPMVPVSQSCPICTSLGGAASSHLGGLWCGEELGTVD